MFQLYVQTPSCQATHRVIRPRVFLLSIVGKMLRAWTYRGLFESLFSTLFRCVEEGLLDRVIVEFVLCARTAKLSCRALKLLHIVASTCF